MGHAGNELKVQRERRRDEVGGIALPSGSPLREPLNRVILAVTQEPEWRRMLESYLGRGD